MTTCTLFTLKDIANKFLVKISILQLQFTQVYHHLRHNILKNKYVAKTINSSWDNIQPMTNINVNINNINNSQLQAQRLPFHQLNTNLTSCNLPKICINIAHEDTFWNQ
jgi:hypothetical protein